MELQVLANILKFLERTTITGNESPAWCEAYQYIQSKINALAQEKLKGDSEHAKS